MKIKKIALTLLLVASTTAISAAEKAQSIGIVDFSKCITESKFGKHEAEGFEAIRAQMQSAIEDLDKQLNETANKLQNKDLLDQLSPEAEQELKVKFQSLNEDMQRYQQQYYQVMQQANMRIIQMVTNEINEASESIAKKDKLSLVINKEAAFHYQPNLDITTNVISEMDKNFDKKAKTEEAKSTPKAK